MKFHSLIAADRNLPVPFSRSLRCKTLFVPYVTFFSYESVPLCFPARPASEHNECLPLLGSHPLLFMFILTCSQSRWTSDF